MKPKIWVIMHSPSTSKKCNEDLELYQKFQRLSSIIKASYKMLNKRSEDLVLFMAPEWYFRKWETGDNYSTKEMKTCISAIKELSRDYKNLLIVPGSFFYEIVEENIKYLYNCVPVIAEGKIKTIVHKWLEADLITENEKNNYNCRWGMFKGFNREPKDFEDVKKMMSENIKSINEKTNELFNIKSDNIGLFDFKGLTFGLEICKDHASGRLKDEIRFNDKKRIDLHLVIANNTKIQKKYMINKQGSYFICLDGNNQKGNYVFYTKGYKPMKYLGNRKNKGENINRMLGLSNSDTYKDRFYILDDDDGVLKEVKSDEVDQTVCVIYDKPLEIEEIDSKKKSIFNFFRLK